MIFENSLRKRRERKVIIGVLLSISAAVVAFIPVWAYLGIRFAFSPTGFWQNFFLLGLGIWFLGGIQIILLVFLIIFLFAIWGEI